MVNPELPPIRRHQDFFPGWQEEGVAAVLPVFLSPFYPIAFETAYVWILRRFMSLAGSWLVLFLLVLFKGDRLWERPLWLLGGVLVLGLLSLWHLAYPLWSVPKMTFAFRSTDVILTQGLWFQSMTVMPYRCVQSIELSRSILERLFGLATVTLHSAAGHRSTLQLGSVSYTFAEGIRDYLSAHAQWSAPSIEKGQE
jgi:hypothetical protein